MASGGFHGGSSHSGGHHSSGGFGGGSHFSGGSHYSGGGGGHYYGGGSSGGVGGDIEFWIYLIVGGAALIIFFLIAVAQGNIPGLNLINLGIFVLSAFLFYAGLKDTDRTSDLNELKRYKKNQSSLKGKVWNGRTPYKKGDNMTWVALYTNEYRISFYDPEYGEENAMKVKETMDRTPKIVWMNPYVWLVLGIVFFFSTFFFYECVIPYFERMIMTDIAFAFIDELVFYLPSVLTLLCAITTIVISKVKDRLLHKCAERIVNDNAASAEREKTENFIASELGKKWYHNFCPNCGAKANFALRSCSSCGSSLEVKDFDKEKPGAVHRISSDSEKENK